MTSTDVHKTWWHLTQEDRKAPSNLIVYKENYEEPQIVDKYTIKVKTKKLSWRQFLYFGGMSIFPAKEIGIPGEEYLKKYNWTFPVGTGPYQMNAADLKKGDSIILTRRKDWWAENEPWAKNTYNFETIKFTVIRERELHYELFKKGELDWFHIYRAQRWVVDIPKEDIVKKGWVKRRKIYNPSPQGFGGLVFNMRKKPFDDRNVRLAFCHLFNRERLMKKLFFNEYEYIKSYFPGRDWGNGKKNERIEFDPDLAEEYFEEAGYDKRDKEGFLVGKDGKRLEVTLRYASQSWERIWLVVKEDYEKAGVKFNLTLMDQSTLIKKIDERQFEIHFQNWSAGLFPNPETMWRSDLADQNNNTNVPGFKNKRVDELCKRYDVTFDRAEQKKITREIDQILFDAHPYALAWYAPFNRILYWDKFGHPDRYVTRIGSDMFSAMVTLWWSDPERAKAMLKAKADGKDLPQGEVVVKPWAGK